MPVVLPKGYKFPDLLEGEDLRDYAIRVKVHPSVPENERVVLHPDDIAAADRTEEYIKKGYIITPFPQPGALVQELMDKHGLSREEAENRVNQDKDKT